MTDTKIAAARAFRDALSAGINRAAAFDKALTVWRRSFPEHSSVFRAVADLATALRALPALT